MRVCPNVDWLSAAITACLCFFTTARVVKLIFLDEFGSLHFIVKLTSMCQLLAINSDTKVDFCTWFRRFSVRGGLTDKHSDGFGVCFYDNKQVRLFLDENPCAFSPLADFVKVNPFASRSIIAHIRKATRGSSSLENVHPFQRQLWNRTFIFAHNGHILTDEIDFSKYRRRKINQIYQPIGQTDSETVFCFILNAYLTHFGTSAPDVWKFESFLQEIVHYIRHFGVFNFVLCDGYTMYVHCSTNLHHCSYTFQANSFSQMYNMSVVTTMPLSDDDWVKMHSGQFIALKDGFICDMPMPKHPSIVRTAEMEHSSI